MGQSDELQKQLDEAIQTAYVGGRWIITSNQFKIVAPILPALGDYSQYNILGIICLTTLSHLLSFIEIFHILALMISMVSAVDLLYIEKNLNFVRSKLQNFCTIYSSIG